MLRRFRQSFSVTKAISLLGAIEIRQIAEELSITPSKSLGQNFVHDSNICEKIVRLAGIEAGDVVLEVGPGIGSLSLSIVKSGAKLVAVEIDRRLADRLSQTLIAHGADQSSFTVIATDAMRLTKEEISKTGLAARKLKIVANLPYNVSVPVILHLLEMEIFESAMVMVQSEVAVRLAAEPGSKDYGVPSAKVAWYAKAQLSDDVPRAVFWPVPRVDSSLLSLAIHQPLASEELRVLTFKVIDLAFNQRRKMLRSALSKLELEMDPGAEKIEAHLIRAGINPTSRAESLSIEDFLAIARELAPHFSRHS